MILQHEVFQLFQFKKLHLWTYCVCISWYVRYATYHMVRIIISCPLHACHIQSRHASVSNHVFVSEVFSISSDRCQSYICAPSTVHMLNSSTPSTRVLQGDMGGERVLQKKWTTFLKAQLLCTLPDDGFPFNIIQDMFVLTPSPEDWKNTVFYGVFTSQW